MKIVIKLEYKKKLNFSNEKVVLLNTRQVFDNAKTAIKKLNLKPSTPIVRVCRGIEKSAGKIKGIPLIWVFYEDYITMSEDEINDKINQSNNKPVICINTGELFNYLSEAGRVYDINPSCISRVCKGKQKYAGKHPKTGELLLWKYIDVNI